MPSAATVRLQVEAALAARNPSALTPRVRSIRPVVSTGIRSIDELLSGGLPVGALTEMAGPECSGRTSLALSFLAQLTQAAKVCAWIDVSDALQPESAAASTIDLARMLWIRCGSVSRDSPCKPAPHFELPHECLIAPGAKKGLHGGGFGPHPRAEASGLSEAVSGFLQSNSDHRAAIRQRVTCDRESYSFTLTNPRLDSGRKPTSPAPWARLDQALRATDLLLQTGGFSAIVLDMGSIRPEHASRVPLATWFRYRAAADKTQATLLLLTQHPCAKSSAELLLRLTPHDALDDETTLFTGIEHRIEVQRQRFSESNLVSFKKPSQSASGTHWQTRATWAGVR